MLNNHRLVRIITEAISAKAAVMLAGTWLLVGMPAASAEEASSEEPSAEAFTASQVSQTLAAEPRDYHTLHVDPALGSDGAEGLEAEPLQTITRALEVATANTVIVLAPGRYSRASGENFPLQMKSGVTIQGMPGTRDRSAIIEGGGTFESPTRSQQNAAIIAADRAGIAQVAISNPDGYGVWVESASPTILETAFVGNRQTGLYVTDGSPRVQNNYFSGNQVAGLIVFGVSSANIASNTFDSTGDAIRVVQGATPEIVGNRIVNNNAGLVLVGDVGPVVRNNQILGNRQNEIVRVAASAREAVSTALTPEAVRTAPTARKVPIPADAIPSESMGDLPMLAATLPAAVPPAATPPAAVPPPPPLPQRLAAAEPTSTAPVTPARRQPLPPLELIPPELIPPELIPPEPSAEPVSERVERQSTQDAVSSADDIESDSAAILAGSPGAALAALRSGVALAPRAVSGENPDSPILRRRRERRNREENNSETLDNRSNPIRRPLPPPVNRNRLSVPNSSIPLGSGSSSTIFSPPTGGSGAPPAPPSRAQALGLFYRVFVETGDPFEQDEVREVIGDAFRTQFEGRTVMQVGAFPTEEEAQDRQRILEDSGFNARIEFIR